MNTPQHDPISRALTREAAQFHDRGGTELEIGQVLARAGEIRRGRRMRATMLMAACVLAVVAPVGIIALDHDSARREPTPARTVVDRSPLTLTGLHQGGAPKVGYVHGSDLHTGATTSAIPGSDRVVALASFNSGVMLAVRDRAGDLRAQPLDGTTSWPMSGDFTVSSDGSRVAFVEPDGTPVVLESASDGSPSAVTLPRIPRGSAFDVVALTGDSCVAGAATPCTVWVTSSGASPESWVSTWGATARRTPPLLRTVTAVDPTGTFVAGIVDVRRDLTTCSAVSRVDQTAQTWSTCDHRLLAFSPDGSHVLATSSAGDGIGDTELAVLDTATGKVRLDLRTAEQAFISQMVWEDDSHVLATVAERGRWGILRIGLDGDRELAVTPEPDSGDLESPFVLPSP